MKKIKTPPKKTLEKALKTLTYKEIAQKYGASESTVARWLRAYNLHKKNNNEAQNEAETEEAAEKAMDELIAENDDRPEDTTEPKKDDPYQKNIERLDAYLNTLILSDTTLVGTIICPQECQCASSMTVEDMAELVIDGIKKSYGMWLQSDRIFKVSDTKIYILPESAKPRPDAKIFKELKWDLWHKYGIFISYYARRGVFYTEADQMFKDTEEQLDYLRKNASHHVSFYGPDDTENAEEPSKAEEEPQKEKLTAPININVDISALPEDTTNDALDNKKIREVSEKELSESESLASEVRPDVTEEAEDVIEPEIDPIDEVRLIDSENVSVSWKNILTDDPGKENVILYTDNTPRVSYDEMTEILQHPYGIVFEKVNPGEKGASGLDFQLVSILGFMINEHPERKYIIVSRDAGYDPVVKYWNEKGYSVSKLAMVNRDLPEGTKAFSTLSGLEKKRVSDACTNEVEKAFHTPSAMTRPATTAVPENDGKKFDKMCFLQKVIPGRKKPVYESIMSILDSHDANDLSHIHADFKDIFGGNHGERMFKKIRNKTIEYKAI